MIARHPSERRSVLQLRSTEGKPPSGSGWRWSCRDGTDLGQPDLNSLWATPSRRRYQPFVRHQASGTSTRAQTAYNASRHVRGSDNYVELKFSMDALHQIICTNDICACGVETSSAPLRHGEYQQREHLAGAVVGTVSAANLLVSVTGVNAQLYVQLDGLIELSLRGGNNGGKRFQPDRTAWCGRSSLRCLHTFYLYAQ